MRKELGLYANLRPIKLFDELLDASSIKPEILKGADILFFRELTVIYTSVKKVVRTMAILHLIWLNIVASKWNVSPARLLMQHAPAGKKLCSVDKANVLETSRLWREVVQKVALEYPDVEVEHQFVDSTAMMLIKDPRRFDVVVTANLFGDILTDEASQIAGSMGCWQALPLAMVQAFTNQSMVPHMTLPEKVLLIH
jgi:3-isopropylmalate dehydrogenase